MFVIPIYKELNFAKFCYNEHFVIPKYKEGEENLAG